ncbi:unnamed protein product [Orchesella dallaii]|uniref:C2H2-type domain-containing protein n=1 Tax=Orchesella dallaii TaxID=48710 RepID=A0ABP1Q1D9_9HEXA
MLKLTCESRTNGAAKQLHCLMCYDKVVEEQTEEKATKELQENLNAIFILKRLLELPNEMLQTYLKHCKGPSNWIGICERCRPIMKEAFDANDKIMELMKQIEKCKALVVDKIKKNVEKKTEEWKSSKKCPTCGNSGCKGHNSYLTDKIRKHVSKKDYILPAIAFENGDNEAKSRCSASLEAHQCREPQPVSKTNPIGWASSLSEDFSDDVSMSPEPSTPEGLEQASSPPLSPVPVDGGTEEMKIHYPTTSDYIVENRVQSIPATTSVSTGPKIARRVECESKEIINSSSENYANDRFKKSIGEKGGNYNCPHCPNLKPFVNVFSYIGHIIFHYDYPFQCSQCKVYLPPDETKLENHWKRFHDEVEMESGPGSRFQQVRFQSHDAVRCYRCWKTFADPLERDSHMETVHKWPLKKQYDCQNCEDKFISIVELSLHRAKFHPEIAKFCCPACPLEFKIVGASGVVVDETRLRDHISSVHSALSIPIVKPCPLCGHMFINSVGCHEEMDSHILNCHFHFLKSVYPCGKCKRNFTTVFARQLHECPEHPIPAAFADSSVSEEGTGPKMYTCPACPNLNEKMSLDKFICHISFHFERPFQCTLCKVYFSEDQAKQDHHWKDWHKDDPAETRFVKVEVSQMKLWECHLCDARFAEDSQRNCHFRVDHSETLQKTKHRCSICPPRVHNFQSSNELTLHEATVHPNTLLYKSFKCPVCSISFKNVTADGKEYLDEPALHKHMDVHHTFLLSSCKMKACKCCGQVFSGAVGHFPNLMTHKRYSHGYGSSVSCHICDDDFASVSLFRNHLSTSHEQLRPKCNFCYFVVEEEDSSYERLHMHKFTQHKMGKKPIGVKIPLKKSAPKASAKAAAILVSKAKATAKNAQRNEKNLQSNITSRDELKSVLDNFTQKFKRTLVPVQTSASAQSTTPLSMLIPINRSTRTKSTRDKVTPDTELEQEEQTQASAGMVVTPNRYSCPTCPQFGFMKLYEFLEHIAFHQQHPNKCAECTVYLPSHNQAVLNHHNEFHKESDQSPKSIPIPLNIGNVWECQKCAQRFSSEEDRDSHEIQEHGRVSSKELPCITCPKKFSTVVDWQFHRRLTHPRAAESRCFYCDEQFTIATTEGIEILDKLARMKHVRKEHSDLPPVQDCCVCRFCGQCFLKSKSSSSATKLTMHLQTEHKVDEDKLVLCPVCPATFKNVDFLKRHVKYLHTFDSSSWQICDVCGWKSKHGGPVLHEHKFKQHGIMPLDTVPLYKCDFDGCSYQTLTKHKLRSHKGQHLPEHERRYRCQECGKGFSDGNKLQRHTDIHKNAQDKPYQCEICGNSFAVKNYLYIHKRLSHQGRRFPSTNKKPKGRRVKANKPGQSSKLVSNTECDPDQQLGTTGTELATSPPTLGLGHNPSVVGEAVSVSSSLHL